MIDYEEALLRVSDALRRHNKPAGGISSREACEDILEAVRPKGKWLSSTDNWYHTCPECKREILKDGAYDSFCPNCGADMRDQRR